MVERAPLASARVSVEDSAEAVYELMYERGWTDGLPVIPPTEERVERMLAYLGRDTQEVVAEVEPQRGVATIEKIAINAVMAGCKPEYMPVLIAAVEALAEPAFNIHGIQCTTNPVAPLAIVNGPIIPKLDINCGRNALGQGRRANATIGRAIRLILTNIGGGLPGQVDQATLGMPGKYSFCLGENEAESPWEPLHVELGFQADESTVTMVGAQGTTNILPVYLKAESVLLFIADAMAYMGSNNVLFGGGNPLVILPPGHAKLLAEQGYSKAEVKRFLYEHSQIPRAKLPPEGKVPFAKFVERDDQICIARRPEDILIVVAGGPEPYHVTYLPNFGDTWAVTKRIVVPQ